MKILLAADGSEHTRRAARFLETLARSLAAPPEIHVMHVHPPIPYAGAAAAAGPDAVRRYHQEESEAALAPAEEVLRDAGLACTSTWIAGHAVAELAAFAHKHAIDLVVMGSHGHGTLRNLTLGSVADGLLRAARVPVTVVR